MENTRIFSAFLQVDLLRKRCDYGRMRSILNCPNYWSVINGGTYAKIRKSETKIITSNFGRNIELDLSTPVKEYQNKMFPLNIILNTPKTTVLIIYSFYYIKFFIPCQRILIPRNLKTKKGDIKQILLTNP